MRRKLWMTVVVLAVAALAMAQTMEEPAEVFDDSSEQLLAGEAELRALNRPPLELGGDLGGACACICRQADPPRAESWSYYQRSLVSGCQWAGRVCVVDGALGTLGACAEAPAPLLD